MARWRCVGAAVAAGLLVVGGVVALVPLGGGGPGLRLTAGVMPSLAVGTKVRATPAGEPSAGADAEVDPTTTPARPAFDHGPVADVKQRLALATPEQRLAFVAASWSSPAAEVSAAPHRPNYELAASLYQEGVALYAADDYEGALVQFQDAFATAPAWRARFNIALVHRVLGHGAEAKAELEAYLAEGGEDIAEERRRDVERMLTEIARTSG